VLVFDRAAQMLARGRVARAPVAALLIDINDFGMLNATYGRAAGDAVLQAVAIRLRGALRDTDTVGRIGPDDFVVLAEGASLVGGHEQVAQRLTRVMSKPFHLPELEAPISVSASIGIAVGDRATAAELLHDAEVALCEAKAAARFRFAVSDAAPVAAPHLPSRAVLE
jgi:diguanylate cyclase (GGDEF)-like protein